MRAANGRNVDTRVGETPLKKRIPFNAKPLQRKLSDFKALSEHDAFLAI